MTTTHDQQMTRYIEHYTASDKPAETPDADVIDRIAESLRIEAITARRELRVAKQALRIALAGQSTQETD